MDNKEKILKEMLKGITGNAKKSIEKLLDGEKKVSTGKSTFSKGWAHKSVWTEETVKAATIIGLPVEKGNDAPKGGASGEFVKVIF